VSGNQPSYGGYSRTDETEQFSVGESPSPWYLKRWVLALWGLAVVTLIAVIIYGLAVLARGNGGSAPAPTTTRTSTPASSRATSTTPSTTPSTTEPATTTTTDVTIDPDPPSASWTPQHPRRHWWRSNVPPIPPIPHF
jgi:cytoskeletal protein RodZ